MSARENEVDAVDPELAVLLQRARNALADVRHAEEEWRTGRVTIPDWPMSGKEMIRLRKRNDNRERWDQGLL